MRKTKIVCTLGPATDKDNVLEELIKNGLNVARCNFSHGSHEEHLGRMNKVKELREKCNKPVAILLDTKGPEIRTGNFEMVRFTFFQVRHLHWLEVKKSLVTKTV